MDLPPAPTQDPRYDFIGLFTLKALKLKPEKWLRVITTEEYKAVVDQFLNQPLPLLLVVVLTNANQLVPVVSFPCNLKNKSCYFVKSMPDVVPKEGCGEMLIYGDLAPKLIDELASLVDEIFVPLLSNPINHEGWPIVVSQDILKQIHNLKSTVNEVKGKVNGQTILPLPVGVELVHDAEKQVLRGEEVDLYLKSAIEGVVIKWAQQVNDVMNDDSALAFENGQNPLPSVELAYWRSRLNNLNYIYDQLCSERVRCMSVILEKTSSAYYPCYSRLYKNTISALEEAKEIDLYLHTLDKHFFKLEIADFTECQILFRPMFHVICMIWRDSKYYCSSSKLIVLLKQINNLLIYTAKKCLDPTTIFQSDITEAALRIRLSIEVIKDYRTTFDYFKDNLQKYFGERKVSPWVFDTNAVFERLDKFSERLTTILWFFETVLEFRKLDNIEIGGIKGKILSGELREISTEFESYYQGFASKTYDVLDPDDVRFIADFKGFQENIIDLDLKLATVLVEAFDNYPTLDDIFKLIEIAGTILDRPLIKSQFTAKFAEIIEMLDKEMTACETKYNEQLERLENFGIMEIDIYMPPVAGGLAFMSTLAARITKPVVSFRNLPHPLGYISEHMNPKHNLAPLLNAQLELLDPEMVLDPTLDVNDEKGLMAILKGIIEDILKMSTLIERIDVSKETSYEHEILNNSVIIEIKNEIINEVDIRPFLQALLNLTRKWGNMYKEHLVELVTSNLTDLGNFIRKADEGLIQPVVEGDYQALINVMGYLMNVKDRTEATDKMFQPVTETINLLKFYLVDIPEEVNVLLQELPLQWAATKKLAGTVKQTVAALQQAEVSGIKEKIKIFDALAIHYKEVFKRYNVCID
ncbi:dynein beta chain, ciliary-like [Ostrinia nubilalis]|uniref:dynein beta chain, ciliary-like n=1 Tax=Ostrinia nubilalis TaxID=29057 RepID=UPI003082380D